MSLSRKITTLRDLIGPDLDHAGADMIAMARRLYPICRSITGEGNRQTLNMLKEWIPLTVHEVPSGSPVFDWVVPLEWNIRDAWIKDASGKKIVDFKKHNLHVVSYSQPIHEQVCLEELDRHLHSLPKYPDWIPYRTSYYQDTWGFCLPDRLRRELKPENYEVFIDAEKTAGSLTYGEWVLPGSSPEEFLISCHICHPSLANDNVSGMCVAAQLARLLKPAPRRHTFRFLFIPGTIGSISWLARNTEAARRVKHGLVLACLGDQHQPTYKKSRRENAEIDAAVLKVLQDRGHPFVARDFSPYGYDERQYGSPGLNMPVGLLTRSSFGEFPEYHNSADNLDFISAASLADSLATLMDVLDLIETNRRYLNTHPMGEPQLGRRGLYEQLGGGNDREERQLALLWVLNQSDGQHSLLDIAIKSNITYRRIVGAASLLLENGLLREDPRVAP